MNELKGKIMVVIKLHDGEMLEKAVSRFKKLVEKEGTVREFKRRQYFKKPSSIKHVKNKTLKRKELLNIMKAKKKQSY